MSLSSFNPFRTLRQRQVDRSLERYEESAGVRETCDVVLALIKLKDYSRAFQYADNGYQRFPGSGDLLELRQRTLKEMSREECRELNRELNRDPRPELVAKIIEIRRSLGEFTACERLARKWRRRFRGSWVLQFAIGKYLFQRSLVEKDRRTSTRCLKQLTIAAELNRTNYKTLLYLATLLYQLGDIEEALRAAKELLQHHPEDTKARALYECIRSTPQDGAAEHSGAAVTAGAGKDEFVNELVRREAVYGVLVHQVQGQDPVLQEARFKDVEVFDFENAESSFGDLVHSLKVSSQRMGIGDLRTCILEGESWQVYFRNHAYRTLLLCTSPEFTEDDFEKAAAGVAPEGVMV